MVENAAKKLSLTIKVIPAKGIKGGVVVHTCSSLNNAVLQFCEVSQVSTAFSKLQFQPVSSRF